MTTRRGTALLLGLAFAANPAGASAQLDTCVSCHAELEEDELRDVVPEWRQSVHADHEVTCDACHGGDPREPDADLSMSEESGFLELPSWREMADHCGLCHEAVAAGFSAGAFGQELRAGQFVPTCDTCHMAHGHLIGRAVPQQLLLDGRCPQCRPVPEASALVELLTSRRRTEREARRTLGSVETDGISLGDLRSDLEALQRGRALALHEFSPDSLRSNLLQSTPELDQIRARLDDFAHRTQERRRYSLWISWCNYLDLYSRSINYHCNRKCSIFRYHNSGRCR